MVRYLVTGFMTLLLIFSASSAWAQNFYCTSNRGSTEQVKPPRPDASEYELRSVYDFYFHNGMMAVSSGSDIFTFNKVSLINTKGGAYIYSDRKGKSWTVTPLGGNRLRIAGPAIYNGAEVAAACYGPQITAEMPRPAPAGSKTLRFACKDGFRFEVMAAVQNGSLPQTITLLVPKDPPQQLTLDPADVDRATWKNAAWEFYSFKNFTTLTERGGRKRFHDCP